MRRSRAVPPRSESEIRPLYMEMVILVNRVGLTPLEAIAAATRNNATALGIEESHGMLEPGCEKLKSGGLEPLPRDVYTDAGS